MDFVVFFSSNSVFISSKQSSVRHTISLKCEPNQKLLLLFWIIYHSSIHVTCWLVVDRFVLVCKNDCRLWFVADYSSHSPNPISYHAVFIFFYSILNYSERKDVACKVFIFNVHPWIHDATHNGMLSAVVCRESIYVCRN